MLFSKQYLLVATAFILLTGCSLFEPKYDVDFETEQSSYNINELIVLHLVNNSKRDIGYNLCGADLESFDREQWNEVKPPSYDSGPCLYIQYSLSAGESIEYEWGHLRGISILAPIESEPM